MSILARVYGITPGAQRELTRRQFRVLQADYRSLQQQQQ